MPYAFAYDIRIRSSEQEVAGPRPRRCRRRILGLLASAVLHRRDAGALDVRVHYPLLVGHVMFARVAMVAAGPRPSPAPPPPPPPPPPPRGRGHARHTT